MDNMTYNEVFQSSTNETRPLFDEEHTHFDQEDKQETDGSIQEFLQIIARGNSGENLTSHFTLNKISANIDGNDLDRYLRSEGISMLDTDYTVKFPIVEVLCESEKNFDFDQLVDQDYKNSRI